MKKLGIIILATSVVLLSACGGGSSDELKGIIKDVQAKQLELDDKQLALGRTADKLQNFSTNLSKAVGRFEAQIRQSKNLLLENTQQVNLIKSEHTKLMGVFNEFNTKVQSLENLYASEGLIELTGEKGKISLSKIPAGSMVKGVFNMEPNTPSHGYITLKPFIETSGEWTINGSDYTLADQMVFYVELGGLSDQMRVAARNMYSLSFKNTHGEVISTQKFRVKVLNENKQEFIELSKREIKGKNIYFIPKGTPVYIVLEKDLDLSIRK